MIRFEDVTKIYQPTTVGLDHVSLHIEKGEFVFLVGPSGSGKSTFIRLLIRELEPDKGRVSVGGRDLAALRRWKVPYLRRNIGCVFQDFKLLPNQTAFENVMYALVVTGNASATSKKKATEMLSLVGLANKAKNYPNQLSGGEQQRVSIARALANRPPVILADEPTAPLDSERALAVIRILEDMAARHHAAIIVVTHDEKIIPTFKRIYHIRDGRTVEEKPARSRPS